jgi:hypothetical protein
LLKKKRKNKKQNKIEKTQKKNQNLQQQKRHCEKKKVFQLHFLLLLFFPHSFSEKEVENKSIMNRYVHMYIKNIY